MARRKIDQLRVSYDKDADVLYISKGNSQETIGEMLDNGIIIRRDLKNKKIIGVTIVDSAMKDNPNMGILADEFALKKDWNSVKEDRAWKKM